MVFSSIPFLFAFLPVTLLGYHALPKRFRNGWLLLASLLFYTWGGGAFVVVLLLSTAVNHRFTLLAWEGKQRGSRDLVRAGVLGSVSMNLLLLSYFKYANFFVDQINEAASGFGWGPVAWNSVVLPIGISFFTFQSMSYTLDVVKGRVEPLRRYRDFALYVALFPQLIAGPIVRFHELREQLDSRVETIERFSEGAVRFALGLMKKVVIADSVALIADAAFGAAPGVLTPLEAWVGITAYTVQIYFDFSGYSDMAIGLGSMLGFRFPENFARPYSARSISDFWRRWHITLSMWFRDYLYVPLGGSRKGGRRTYAHLWIVFLATGFWHGASWTFLVWGAYHGLLLTIERMTGLRSWDPAASVITRAIRRAMVLGFVMVGWVFFRAPDVGQAFDYLRTMFGLGEAATGGALALALSNRGLIALLIGVGTFFLPRTFVMGPVVTSSRSVLAGAGRWVILTVGMVYSTLVLAGGTFSPFLYFQF